MRLSDDQYEFIKGEVVALFEHYDIRCVPISGFELAYKMGISMIPYSCLTPLRCDAAMKISTDGFYMEDQLGNDTIYYNDDIAYSRANMTILHEIGHCALDHQGNSGEEESEANFFAKYAIAPPPLVHRIKPQSPAEIENVFCLSHSAAAHAFEYYQKWLAYGGVDYSDYELRLLTLFGVA